MNKLTPIIKNYIRNEVIELHNSIRITIFKIIENKKSKLEDVRILKELEKYYNNIVNKLIELI
jgi:hypothetical protein